MRPVRRTGWRSPWRTRAKGWRPRISSGCSSHSSGPTPRARAPARASALPWLGASLSPSAVGSKLRAGGRSAPAAWSSGLPKPPTSRQGPRTRKGGPGDPPFRSFRASELDWTEEVLGGIASDAHVSHRRRSKHRTRRREQIRRHPWIEGHRVECPVAAVVPDRTGGDRDDPLLTRYTVRDRVEGVDTGVRERRRRRHGADELPVVE